MQSVRPSIGLEDSFYGLDLGIYGLGLDSSSDNFLASPSNARKV